jgi:hypothetical protein
MYKRFHYGLALAAKSFDIDISVLTRKWVAIYESRLSCRGKQDAVRFCKELNTVCERYALRQDITPIPWTKSDNDGFPVILGRPFREFLRSQDPRKVVFALSVMRSCEALRLPISKDISTVTEPCNSDADLIADIIDFTPQWVSRLQRVSLRSMKYHFTVKNGPNGHALHASDSDISAVMNDPELFEAIQTVQEQLKDVSPMETSVPAREHSIHSKLTQFPEKSGKTRTIAVVDYYSQRCLKPLHDSIMKLLSSLVSDGTYSHQNVGKFAQQKTKEKSFIYCADLTAFTDRFPAEIQRVLLFELLKNDVLSQALWTLLAKRTFVVAWSKETVTYQCGQPMGAYASWPLCSLAHHLLVEYAGHLVGKPAKYQYKLIGDDVIITEPEIAQKYEQLIKALGVSINYSKTVTSSAQADYSGAEVAKQLYLNGTCLTPMTPGFIRSLRKTHMFNTCVEVLKERYEFYRPETPSMLINLLFKQTKREKVWLLCSNPINGVVKPGEPGYNDSSPWISTDVEKKKEDYNIVIVNQLLNKAETYMDSEFEYMMSGESPWKDSSQPQPRCLSYIKRDISRQLTKALERLGDISIGEQPATLVAEFDFIPDPMVPFMERKELRQRRMSSVIESLFDYNDDTTFVQLDW